MKHNSDHSIPPLGLLLLTVFAFLLSSFAGAAIGQSISTAAGVSLSTAGLSPLDADGRHTVRTVLLLGNLLSFAGAAGAVLIIVFRSAWWRAAGLVTRPASSTVIAATGLFVVCLPLVIYTAWLNLQVPLPDWAIRDENQVNALLAAVLRMESPGEFFFAFVTAAIVPAVGEELLLRGVLQRRILLPLLNNHHVAVWIAAAVFSAGHAEFAGFLPRLLLGAALGYAYHWTKSLWVPILLHLLFNGTQVINAYVTGVYQPDTTVTFVPPHWMGVLGLVAAGAALYYGGRFVKARNAPGPSPFNTSSY